MVEAILCLRAAIDSMLDDKVLACSHVMLAFLNGMQASFDVIEIRS